MEPNKQIRLNRIFAPDHRSVVVAMDHGIMGISPLAYLIDPAKLIPEVIAGGANALIVTPGTIRKYGALFGRTGIILRIDGGPTAEMGEWNEMKLMFGVEDALRMGADAVIMMGAVGVEGEVESLTAMGKVAARCADWGIPLVGEMLPGGFVAKEVSAEKIAIAARLGAELGADVIKIRYGGPVEAFQKVVEACYCPVLILGGSKQPPSQLLSEVCDAMAAGAAGVAIGRNVWQQADPREMTRKIHEAVHA